MSAGIAKLSRGETRTMQSLKIAAGKIEKATAQPTSQTSDNKQWIKRAVIDPPGSEFRNLPWANSTGAQHLGQLQPLAEALGE